MTLVYIERIQPKKKREGGKREESKYVYCVVFETRRDATNSQQNKIIFSLKLTASLRASFPQQFFLRDIFVKRGEGNMILITVR